MRKADADARTRHRRREAKASRRRARDSARARPARVRVVSPATEDTPAVTVLVPGRKRTRRGRRQLSERRQTNMLDAGASKLLGDMFAKLKGRDRRRSTKAAERRAARDALRHRERWSPKVHAQAALDRKRSRQERGS